MVSTLSLYNRNQIVIKFQYVDNVLFRVQLLLVEKHTPKTRGTIGVFF